MAEGLRTGFDVTGLAPLLAKLHQISDPKVLEKTTRESLAKTATRVIAPKLASHTGWKYGGHGGRYPTKGLLSKARSEGFGAVVNGKQSKTGGITARKIKTRPGEMVAIGVKPRGWAGAVEAWVVKGTKPHVIRARGGSNSQSGVDSRARRINRGTETLGDRGALAFGGRFATVVNHPGAQPTDYIHDAAQGLEKPLMDGLAKDLFAAMEKAARGKK